MPSAQKLTLVMFAVVFVACASGTRGSSTAPGPSRWTGNFKPNRLNSELGRSAPNSGFGSITLMPSQGPSRRTRIEISISVPVPAGEHVAWGMLSGTCGSAHPMLTGRDEFPRIEVGENGNGSLRVDMPFTLDVNGSYHANVYWPNSSRDLNDVMMCANLSFGGR
jgi:hypothetical protein